MAELWRPSKAGSNTAVDHVAVFDAVLAQLPEPLRRRDEQGRVAVLVRTDAAGATHQFAAHLAATGAQFSLRENLGHVDIHTALAQLPPTDPSCPTRNPRQTAVHAQAGAGLAQQMIAGKILNSRVLLRRNTRGEVSGTVPALKRLAEWALVRAISPLCWGTRRLRRGCTLRRCRRCSRSRRPH